MVVRTEDGDSGYQTVGQGAAELHRYAGVTFENDAVVIYDTTDETAWIQSDSGVDLERMR